MSVRVTVSRCPPISVASSAWVGMGRHVFDGVAVLTQPLGQRHARDFAFDPAGNTDGAGFKQSVAQLTDGLRDMGEECAGGAWEGGDQLVERLGRYHPDASVGQRDDIDRAQCAVERRQLAKLAVGAQAPIADLLPRHRESVGEQLAFKQQ